MMERTVQPGQKYRHFKGKIYQDVYKRQYWAREQGMLGLALEAQDTNLNAARFYEACGFEIGCVNTKLYENFGGPREYALFWYKNFHV